MSFTLPSETVVEAFLPTFRSMLAEALDDRDFTQERIADTLGVSQPAVSQYAGGDVDRHPALASDPAVQDAVVRLADDLAADALTEPAFLAEVVALVRSLQDRGTLCELHEREMPSLQGLGCDVCVRGTDHRALAERRALHGVREAARALERAPAVVDHVPAVGTNVAEAVEGADDPSEVAAIPGRITAMRGRLHVPAGPEMGASSHVAGVVLAAIDADRDVRAALNLATSESLLDALRDGGATTARFDAETEDRRDALAERFRRDPRPDVVYHEGAFGVEPVTYVLAASADEAVGRVVAAID